MNITKRELIAIMDSTGAPYEHGASIPQRLNGLAKWCFVRNKPESEITKTIREALLELDNTGMIEYRT